MHLEATVPNRLRVALHSRELLPFRFFTRSVSGVACPLSLTSKYFSQSELSEVFLHAPSQLRIIFSTSCVVSISALL